MINCSANLLMYSYLGSLLLWVWSVPFCQPHLPLPTDEKHKMYLTSKAILLCYLQEVHFSSSAWNRQRNKEIKQAGRQAALEVCLLSSWWTQFPRFSPDQVQKTVWLPWRMGGFPSLQFAIRHRPSIHARLPTKGSSSSIASGWSLQPDASNRERASAPPVLAAACGWDVSCMRSWLALRLEKGNGCSWPGPSGGEDGGGGGRAGGGGGGRAGGGR
jgi:hypothetical protein